MDNFITFDTIGKLQVQKTYLYLSFKPCSRQLNVSTPPYDLSLTNFDTALHVKRLGTTSPSRFVMHERPHVFSIHSCTHKLNSLSGLRHFYVGGKRFKNIHACHPRDSFLTLKDKICIVCTRSTVKKRFIIFPPQYSIGKPRYRRWETGSVSGMAIEK